MCRFRSGRERQVMADRSAPLRPVRVKMWSLIMARNRIDRGVMKPLRSEMRRGNSDYQERKQSCHCQKRLNTDRFVCAASGTSVERHKPHPMVTDEFTTA